MAPLINIERARVDRVSVNQLEPVWFAAGETRDVVCSVFLRNIKRDKEITYAFNTDGAIHSAGWYVELASVEAGPLVLRVTNTNSQAAEWGFDRGELNPANIGDLMTYAPAAYITNVDPGPYFESVEITAREAVISLLSPSHLLVRPGERLLVSNATKLAFNDADAYRSFVVSGNVLFFTLPDVAFHPHEIAVSLVTDISKVQNTEFDVKVEVRNLNSNNYRIVEDAKLCGLWYADWRLDG